MRLGVDWVAPWDDPAEVPLDELVECDAGVESPLGVWTGGVGSGGALTTGFGMVTLGVEIVGVGVVPTVIDGVVTAGSVTEGTLTVGTVTVGTDTVGTDTVGIVGAAVEVLAGTSSAAHATREAGTARRAGANQRAYGPTGQRSPPDPSATEGLDTALPTAHPSSFARPESQPV